MRSNAMILIAGLAGVATASWRSLEIPGAGSRPSPRTAAIGSPVWIDSSRYDLFHLAGDPVGLVSGTGEHMSVEFSTSGTPLSGSGEELYQSSPVALAFGASNAGKYGLAIGVELENQEQRTGTGAPDYTSTRLRWGLDAGASLLRSRWIMAGFGLHGRFPSIQKQDSSGNGAEGKFQRWQPALEAVRLSLGSRIADFLTLSIRVEAAAEVDSLDHTAAGTTTKTLQRRGRVLLPWLGFGAQFERPGLPVTGVIDYGSGTAYRMGVLRPSGVLVGAQILGGENIDMPQLTTDTSRLLAACIGRIDRLPGHVFRPALSFHAIGASTHAYAPVPGAQSTDFARKGDALPDTSWTFDDKGFALGMAWEWDAGLKLSAEWERSSLRLARGAGLLGGATDEHVDHRVSLGLEAGHQLVPLLRESFPQGASACLRLGLRKQSLAGTTLEPGFLSGLQVGTEPIPSYRRYQNSRNWTALESSVGLAPTLGPGGDETAVTVGLGGAILNGTVGLDATLVFANWKADDADAATLSGTGWNIGVHWRL